MPSPATSQFPVPKSWDEFEDIVFDVFRRRWDDPHAKRNGRSGQEQHGVDIYGQPKELEGNYAGVQCKLVSNGALLVGQVEAEIAKAEEFKPDLAEYIIVTTANRDQHLQRVIRDLNEERANSDRFRVEIIFWDEICVDLAGEKNHDLLLKYYGSWVPAFARAGKLEELAKARAAIATAIEDTVGGPVDRLIVDQELDLLIQRLAAATLFEAPLDAAKVSDLSPIVRQLFSGMLDRHALDEAISALHKMFDALAVAAPFTNAHANLLYEIGFLCWCEGTPSANRPRISQIPGQFGDVQGVYLTSLRHLIYQFLREGPPAAVEELSWVIAYLADDTGEAGGSESFIGRVEDIVLDSDLHAHLMPHVLQELANGLGLVRRRAGEQDKDIVTWIDSLVDRLADILRAMGQPDSEIFRLQINGGFNLRRPARHKFGLRKT